MTTFSPKTRYRIKGYLEAFINELVEQSKNQKIQQHRLNPFYTALMPEEISKISALKRSLDRKVESTFTGIAFLVALEHHAEVKRHYDVEGYVSQAALEEIERQVEFFEKAADVGTKRPDFTAMILAALQARKADDERFLRVRADLYIRKHNGEELFFEIKSPVPNKGQCVEVTQRILRFDLLRAQPRPRVQGYFAMAYNPYGSSRNDYEWSMARNYLPFDEGVLIGQEFWELVGGPTAYEELLDIYQEAGREKSKYIIDSLA